MVQLAQQIVEAWMSMKRVQLRIDSHPQHLRIAAFVCSFEQVECFFGKIELAGDECEMKRRNVTALGQQVHVIQYGLRFVAIAGGRMSSGETCERVRSLAH